MTLTRISFFAIRRKHSLNEQFILRSLVIRSVRTHSDSKLTVNCQLVRIKSKKRKKKQQIQSANSGTQFLRREQKLTKYFSFRERRNEAVDTYEKDGL